MALNISVDKIHQNRIRVITNVVLLGNWSELFDYRILNFKYFNISSYYKYLNNYNFIFDF